MAVVFHPSVDIMPCAFRLAYIRLKFDWKAEEMEGKRAVSLSRMITHPAPQRVWYVLFICNNSAVSWFVRLVRKFIPFLIFSSFMLCVVLLTAGLVYLPCTFGSFSYPRSFNVIAWSVILRLNCGQYVEFKTFCTSFWSWDVALLQLKKLSYFSLVSSCSIPLRVRVRVRVSNAFYASLRLLKAGNFGGLPSLT